MTKNDIEYSFSPFLSLTAWHILYKPGHYFEKLLGILLGYIRRIKDLFRIHSYDYVFVHRESSPFGPNWFEYIAVKWLRKKLIFDFDDSIWIRNYSESNKVVSFLKRYNNTRDICKLAYKVSVGNAYLAAFAKQYNTNIVINPTTIDMERYNCNKVPNNKLVIGWTGSHSTVKYLQQMKPVLEKLSQHFDFELHIISNQKPDFILPNIVFIKWSSATEIQDLCKFDIGIMPLEDDDWSRGKCGLKALQYMALNIPSLISPVGVNRSIIEDQVNGLYCTHENEWFENLKKIIEDDELRKLLSSNAKEKVQNHFSVNSNTQNFLSLFNI
ncbi:MAG TPA: glycosyltransferase family 4 protein [Bacteroidia bacterium]|nr:glycosyltransferase family 4 protein [Bacteroidia bacterium]